VQTVARMSPRRATPARARTRSRSRAQSDQSESVADRLGALDATFLECRDLHHAWTVAEYRADGGRIVRTLVCDRCGTHRHDVWSTRGERVGASYDYPDGYSLAGSDYPTDRAAMRREVLRRAGVTRRRR